LSGLTFAILLLVAMIKHQNLNGQTYFATFHAWISLILIAGFIVQVNTVQIKDFRAFVLESVHICQSNFPETHAVAQKQL
jgi:hypothetical protein